jgi:hypothetical protein
MTDISLQETATTVKTSRGRPFMKGQSGNPGGRPGGSLNRSTRATQLLLDGEATPATISSGFEWRAAGRGSCHTPIQRKTSKPTAELPLILPPVAALQPRISAAERSRSLYFRCKKQQKQPGASVAPAQRDQRGSTTRDRRRGPSGGRSDGRWPRAAAGWQDPERGRPSATVRPLPGPRRARTSAPLRVLRGRS